MIKKNLKFKKPFLVLPETVSFANYEDSQVYVKKIMVKNNDFHIQQVNVRLNGNDELRLNVYGDQRLVPGLDIILEVVFCPIRSYKHQKLDRMYQIELLSDLRDKQKYRFLIPILLLSTNPSLMIPNEIVLPKTCPNIPSYSTMFICNYGSMVQRFTLTHPTQITVEPFKKDYSIASGKHETLLIRYKSNVIGEETYEISFNFDSSKRILVPIKSCTIECTSVYFKEPHLSLPETYLGYTSVISTQIINESDFKVKFNFCAFPSLIEDNAFKQKVQEAYGRYLHYNYDRVNDVESESAISRDVHRCVLDRQLLSYRYEASRLIIPFQSKFFEIVPSEGEIFPKSSTTINVIFHPPPDVPQSDAGSRICIEERAYMDLNSDTRIELRMSGVVLGPKIDFEMKKYRLPPMHCGETHEFDVICKNNGILDADITFEALESRFGGEVLVNPDFLALKPNEKGNFNVKYTNLHTGRFLDQLRFVVTSGDTLYVKVMGNVKPLIVHVTPSLLDFGQVSICCEQFLYVRVKNILDCPIRVNFELENRSSECLCFNEFEAMTPASKTEQSYFEETLTSSSKISFVSDVNKCFDDGLRFKNVLGRLLFEYEKFESETSDTNGDLESLHDSIEAVNEILGDVLCKVDHYLDIEDYRENLETNIHQLIDNWIENKQLIEILLDDALDKITDKFETSFCDQFENFIPFFQKDWILNENAQEYFLSKTDQLHLKPHETQSIRVSLIPNWPGISRSKLKLHFSWDDNAYKQTNCPKSNTCSNMLLLPLMHNCIIPELILDHTDQIEIETYVGQSSSHIIRIKNVHETVDGFVYAVPFVNDEISIQATPDKEIIPRNMERNFKITITCYVTGNLEYLYQLFTFGNDKSIQMTFKIKSKSVQIKAEPRVVITENVLIGEVSVAEFLIRNLSPVQVEYDIEIRSNNSGRYSIEEFDPYLMPHDMVRICVTQCFDTPGFYEAFCVIGVLDDYGPPEKVKLETRVVGVPLRITPNLKNNLLDLGLIIFDKRPFPSIEFVVENISSVKYYVIPTLQYDEDLKLDESRIEILPKKSHRLRIQICPKIPKKISNVLFFNASISGMSKDYETFKMISIRGNVVKPDIYFSTSEVMLEIKHGDDYDKVGHAIIYLINNSLINLCVNCTINGEYELIDTENCLIDTCLEIEISPKEKKEIAVHFNTDLVEKGHKTKSYEAKIRAFIDGKLHALANVKTVVKYPSIVIEKSCLQIYQAQLECFTSFLIQNSDDIEAEYEWEFVEDSLLIHTLSNVPNHGTMSVIDEILEGNDLPIMGNFLEELKSTETEEIEIEELPSENEEGLDTKKAIRRKKSKKVSIQAEPLKPTKKKKKDESRKSSATSDKSETTSLISTATNVSKKSRKGKRKRSLLPKESLPEIDQSTIEVSNEELDHEIDQILIETEKEESFFSEVKSTSNQKFVLIFPSFGTLPPNTSQPVSILFKENPHPCKYSFILRLNIKNGGSRNIEIQTVNDRIHLEFNKTIIDLGTQSWFSIQRNSFDISTSSQIPICVKYVTTEADDDTNELLHGKHLLNETRVRLSNNYLKHTTKMMVFMGLNHRFERTIGVEVNNRAPIILKIRGRVQIPNVTFLKCQEMGKDDEVWNDYEALREMFVQWNEGLILGNGCKKKKEEIVAPSNSKVSIHENLNITNEEEELGFELVDSNEITPNFFEIKTFTDQSALIRRVLESQEVASHMEYLTKSHVKEKFNKSHMTSPKKYIYTGKPTSFPIEPISMWCMPVQAYLLDLGTIKLNECKKVCFEFVFHGVGKFNACVRAERAVQGLSIKFIPPIESESDEIPFKFTLKEYLPEINKKTKFKPSRDCSKTESIEITHAHSFDFTNRLVHIRKSRDPEEMSKIKEHYNKISANHKKRQVTRDPNTYAEIFQETSRNAFGQLFGISIEFQAFSSFYGKNCVEFKEKLYLDMHLGASVPLVLEAKLIPTDWDIDNCSCMKKVQLCEK